MFCRPPFTGDDQSSVKTPLQHGNTRGGHQQQTNRPSNAEFAPSKDSTKEETSQPTGPASDAALLWSPGEEPPPPQEEATTPRQETQDQHTVGAEDFFPEGDSLKQKCCSN